MKTLKQYQGTVFNKDNIPDLLEYLAAYMRENPECEHGFGLELTRYESDIWKVSDGSVIDVTKNVLRGIVYRIKTKTRTLYSPITGEAKELPAPMGEQPYCGETYFIENFGARSGCSSALWGGLDIDYDRFELGIYSTSEDAAANCKFRYGVEDDE